MKKWILAMVLCLWPFKAQAVQSTVWSSSNVAVNVSTAALCGQYLVGTSTVATHAIFHGVCINTSAAGNVQVFASSFTAVNSISGLYSTATQVPCNFYDAASPSGLSYNKNGTADVTILYQCY